LNPLKYTHPVLSLVLPIIFIALGGIGVPGGAVYVRTSFMTNRQKTIVSLSGPLTNVAFAVILLAVTALFYDPDHNVFWAGMAFSGFLQVTAAVRNLLPVPGLDGYSALEPHLSEETQRALAPAKQWGLFILLILFIATPLSQYFFAVITWFVDLSGVERFLVGSGLRLTQFWSAWR
jgi:Zn-dependent protease